MSNLRIRKWLHGTPGVVPPPLPPTDSTYAIRFTDAVWTEDTISDLLAANVSNDNLVTVTNDSSVLLQVWDDTRNIAPAGSGTFTMRELRDPFCQFITTAAPLGSGGNLYFAFKASAAESGATTTKTLTFTIVDYPALTYPMGASTPAGWGGFPVHLLPGTLTDWAITAQSTAGALSLWGEVNSTTLLSNASTLSGWTGTKAWLTWAGTTYGGTTSPGKTVASPTTGPATYTATLTNAVLGRSITVTMDVTANCRNVRPAPGRDSTSANQLRNGLPGAFAAKTLCEPGTYISMTGPRPGNAATGAGGQVAPTSPFVADGGVGGFVDGWNPDGLRARKVHASWRQVKGRAPGAVLSGTFTLDLRNVTNVYMRMSGLAATIVTDKATASDGNPYYTWVMCDHIQGNLNLGDTDRDSAMFAHDCCGANKPAVYGRDSQMVGTITRNSPSGDGFNYSCYNTDAAQVKCAFSWNFGTDKRVNGPAGDHGDWAVWALGTSGTSYPLVAALPAGSTVDAGRIYGNIFFRGYNPMIINAAGQNTDTMGFRGLHPSNVKFNWKIGGNIIQTAQVNGIPMSFHGAGSAILNNSMVGSFNIPNPGDSLSNVRAEVSTGPNDVFPYAHNISRAGFATDATGTPPTQTNNRSASSEASWTPLLTNPSDINTSRTRDQVIGFYTPLAVAGGLTQEANGSPRARIQGAVGDTTLIDHRRQTIAATFWD